MASSAADIIFPRAVGVDVTEEALIFALSDGRTITIPLSWYPRLAHATAAERENWQLIGKGEGVHWPDVDEDISVDSLVKGRPSAEGTASLQRWLTGRRGAHG